MSWINQWNEAIWLCSVLVGGKDRGFLGLSVGKQKRLRQKVASHSKWVIFASAITPAKKFFVQACPQRGSDQKCFTPGVPWRASYFGGWWFITWKVSEFKWSRALLRCVYWLLADLSAICSCGPMLAFVLEVYKCFISRHTRLSLILIFQTQKEDPVQGSLTRRQFFDIGCGVAALESPDGSNLVIHVHQLSTKIRIL